MRRRAADALSSPCCFETWRALRGRPATEAMPGGVVACGRFLPALIRCIRHGRTAPVALPPPSLAPARCARLPRVQTVQGILRGSGSRYSPEVLTRGSGGFCSQSSRMCQPGDFQVGRRFFAKQKESRVYRSEAVVSWAALIQSGVKRWVCGVRMSGGARGRKWEAVARRRGGSRLLTPFCRPAADAARY